MPKEILTRWFRALIAYEQAQANFEVVDPEYIDVAIAELNAAERRLVAIKQEAERLGVAV